jgi:hypothetical protein
MPFVDFYLKYQIQAYFSPLPSQNRYRYQAKNYSIHKLKFFDLISILDCDMATVYSVGCSFSKKI